MRAHIWIFVTIIQTRFSKWYKVKERFMEKLIEMLADVNVFQCSVDSSYIYYYLCFKLNIEHWTSYHGIFNGFWIFKPSNEITPFFSFINFWRVKCELMFQWREYYPLNFVINVIITSTCYNVNEHEPTIHPVNQSSGHAYVLLYWKWFFGMYQQQLRRNFHVK